MTQDRRADPRLLLHTRVEISGVDKAGLQFSERSKLEDVGDGGCSFSLRNAVSEEPSSAFNHWDKMAKSSRMSIPVFSW